MTSTASEMRNGCLIVSQQVIDTFNRTGVGIMPPSFRAHRNAGGFGPLVEQFSNCLPPDCIAVTLDAGPSVDRRRRGECQDPHEKEYGSESGDAVGNWYSPVASRTAGRGTALAQTEPDATASAAAADQTWAE